MRWPTALLLVCSAGVGGCWQSDSVERARPPGSARTANRRRSTTAHIPFILPTPAPRAPRGNPPVRRARGGVGPHRRAEQGAFQSPSRNLPPDRLLLVSGEAG